MTSGTAVVPMIAVTASPALARVGKTARNVTVSPVGRGTSRTVAPVTTPSVPSDPTNNRVRSYPTTSFRVRPPVRTTSPEANTTSSPATLSAVTPYFTQRSPPALVAMLPPIVDSR